MSAFMNIWILFTFIAVANSQRYDYKTEIDTITIVSISIPVAFLLFFIILTIILCVRKRR